MVHNVYYNHNFITVGCRKTKRVLLRWLPGRNWTFNNGPQQHVTTKTTNSKYDMFFLASLIITKYDFNAKSLTLWARRKWGHVYERRMLPGFRLLFLWSVDRPKALLWRFPHTYFGLICALELLELQLLRGSLADRICKRHSSLLKLLKASCGPF